MQQSIKKTDQTTTNLDTLHVKAVNIFSKNIAICSWNQGKTAKEIFELILDLTWQERQRGEAFS